MGSTVGIHLVWTTYGTWLPGDPSKPGHWSPLFDEYGHLRRAGHRINLPDATTCEHARSLMKEPPKALNAAERRIVAEVIGSHIAPALAGVQAGRDASVAIPGVAPALAGFMWGEAREIVRAYACAVEATHVHLLVGPVHEDIARFAGRLKGSTSSALLKHPDNRGRKRIWTAGFWKVFLFDDKALTVVQRYIERHHRHEGEPALRYDWLRPLVK